MENIINYLLSPELIPSPFNEILSILRIVFLILSLILFFVIAAIFLGSQWLNKRYFEDVTEFVRFKPHETNRFLKEWKKITKRQNSGSEAEYKLAVIEADALLDEVLKRIGHTEETIEEKLKVTPPSELKNVEELKEIRKTRNSVVYDPDYELTLQKTREVLKVYEEALRNLRVFS